MHERYHEAMRYTALALRAGEHVFAPIVYTHVMAQTFSMPKDYLFWRPFNMEMLRADIMDELTILKTEGWHQSKGVQDELQEAEEIGLKIKLVSI